MALKPANVAVLALVAVLSGCGERADDPLLNTARDLAGDLFASRTAPAPAVDPRQVLTRDLIDRAAVPLILVENRGLGTASTMVRIAVNGPNGTWQGDDDVSLTLSREGVLRATRGFGPDLYAADIADTRALLAAGRDGTADRLFGTVVGDLENQQTGYRCEVAFAGSETITIIGETRRLTRVTERCTGQPSGESFENLYWVDGEGFAWASEQWAGPDLGHFRFERLHR